MMYSRQFGRFGPRIPTIVLVLLTLLLAPAYAQEQAKPATLAGVIRDTSAAVVPEAAVDVLVAGRVIATTTSNANGQYRLQVPADVPVEVRVRREGFAEEIANLPGFTGSSAHDVTLHVGSVADTLVVTASRAAESRVRTTGSVSVMTAPEIAAIGAVSLADVVRTVPGMHVESNGREGSVTSLFPRGGESDYTLVLIDGVRVNQAGGAFFDFGRIAAGEIERVEVVRGAQSALYGSDAMGGVVQVFTKRAGRNGTPEIAGDIEAGSFHAVRGGARVSGGTAKRVDYYANVAARRTDGAFSEALPEDDRFEHVAFDGSVGVALGSRANLRTGLRASTADGRSVGQIAYGPGDRGTRYDTRDVSWHLDFAHSIGRALTGTATVSYFAYRSESADTIADPAFNVYTLLEGTPGAIFPDSPRLVRLLGQGEFQLLAANGSLLQPGQFLAFTGFGVSDFPSDTTTKFRRPAFKYQADYTWKNGQTLSAGYEYEHESNPLVAGFEMTNNAVFVQQQLDFQERWFATVGARVDDKSRFGTFFSPRLSVGGFLMPATQGPVSSVKVFANVGKGIKSPTFGEFFGSAFTDGNLDLEPERARTADVGAEITFASQRLRGSVTYFDNDYRDQVAFSFSGSGSDGRPDFINIDGSEAHGWELEAAVQRPIGGFTGSVSYSFVDTKVVTTVSTSQQFQPGQPLLRRPKHSGFFHVAYTAGRITANADTRFVGERHDSSFLFLTTVPGPFMPRAVGTDITVNPGYAVVGAGVDVRAHDALTVFLRADNIGDTRYESALGYPGLPRAFVVGARFGFPVR